MVEKVYIPTLKIKSTHPPSQGDFVVINAKDFDPAKGHVLYSQDAPVIEPNQVSMTSDELRAALTAAGIEYPAKAKRAELLKLLPNA